MDADLEKKCSYAHRQVEEYPSRRCKKNGDKSAVAMLKTYGNLLSTMLKVTIDQGDQIRNVITS